MRERGAHVRTAVAFVAAIVTALLAVPTVHCVALGVGLSSRGSCSGSFAGYMVFGSVIAIPAAAVFGIPLYLVFRKLDWLSWWQVSLGAGLAGALSALALHFLDGTTNLLGSLGMFAGLGAIAGIAFWAFGVRRLEP